MNTSVETPEESKLYRMIAAHPFFKGLPAQHLRTLENSAMAKEFSAGELIFSEGELANRFYLIIAGKVAIESREDEHDPILIQKLGPGDELGWSWLFPPFHWHFEARALEPTSAIFFYGTRLREQCEQDTALGYQLMKRMAEVVIQRLQATRHQLIQATKPRPPGLSVAKEFP